MFLRHPNCQNRKRRRRKPRANLNSKTSAESIGQAVSNCESSSVLGASDLSKSLPPSSLAAVFRGKEKDTQDAADLINNYHARTESSIGNKQSQTTARASRNNMSHCCGRSLLKELLPTTCYATGHNRSVSTFILSLCLIKLCLAFASVSSQRVGPNNEPTSAMQYAGADLQAESRAEHIMRQSPPSNTLELLTNLLNSYQQPRGSPRLPLAQNNNQMVPASTPLNPFNAQYQPNLAARRPQHPQQQMNSDGHSNFPRINNNNNMGPMLMASSSPPTPYLTLNRLSNIANQQQGNNNNRQINLQPINTIPLGAGSLNSNNNNNPFRSGPRRPPMPQQNRGQQMRPMASVQLPVPPPPMTNTVKPISGGFAPSGPPPTQPNENNAMVLVQSPPNTASTTRPTTSASQAGTEGPAADKQWTMTPVNDNNERLPTTATNTTTTTTEAPKTTTVTSPQPSFSTSETSQDKGSSWSPVDAAPTSNNGAGSSDSRPKISLAPSLDIVTVPPGYNPDRPAQSQPEVYDIPVSAKMGEGGSPIGKPTPVLVVEEPSSSLSSIVFSGTTPTIDVTTTTQSNPSEIPTVAPTAVTTIIWSPSGEASNVATATIQPSKTLEYGSRYPQVTQTAIASASASSTQSPPSRIRDNSMMINDEPAQTQDQAVVYGKPQTRDSKPSAPPEQAGRPFIKPAPLDSQVRPFTSGSQQPLLKSNHNSQSPFKASRPMNGNQTPLSVGSGFTIMASGNQTMPTGDIQDYVANQPPPTLGTPPSSGGNQIGGSFQVSGDSQEPTISAQGGPDPATFDLSAQDTSASVAHSSASSNSSASSSPAPRIKRPTFKPKPVEPLIRIDSCIVGDESSCEQKDNERCITEYGISSCHCKPGYARLAQVRGFCSPVSAFQMTLKIDKLSDDRRLAYNHTLQDPNTGEYQYMEFETVQSLLGMFQQTSMFDQYLGSRVNKFFEHKGKVYANVTLNLVANNVTRSSKITQLVGQDLAKIVKPQISFGDSTIQFDGSKESVSRLTDVNECANPELNDCSKQATCTNDFGGFHCQCLPGYEDKHANKEKSKHGRVCLGCSAAYCSNRGECTIVEGKKQCKCRPNFIGSRCDIDSEVMAVAIGGSLVGVIILIVTFWLLFIFNGRWKREQQKMDAMSATSGLTFNYVNSSTNSLISPARIDGGAGGLHRTGGLANSYSHRFGVNMTGVGRSANQHYAPDQQAIMGSTSSGSSAASQQMGGACNHYAPTGAAFQYEDAGLLIAPASAGSSEQTSPSGNSLREYALNQLTGTAYTLSGHHHHNNHSHHHNMHNKSQHPLTQFHPAAGHDYRTLNMALQQQQHQYDAAGAHRWRTLQQDNASKALVGYYLSPDMLVNHQQHQQQLYASPQRELCIDTDGNNQLALGRSRRLQGRSGNTTAQTLRSRSQAPSRYLNPHC